MPYVNFPKKYVPFTLAILDALIILGFIILLISLQNAEEDYINITAVKSP